jgi:hypothetical protein
MLNNYYAYSFLFGMFIGGYTNFFSKVIISGLVVYMVHPDNFNIKKFEPLYNTIYITTQPYISKIYKITDIEGIEEEILKEEPIKENPKITILPSPFKREK